MNARQLEQIAERIKAVAANAGFEITRLWPSGKGFGLGYRRAAGQLTVWEVTAPRCTSARGRLDFSICHATCEQIEKVEKKRLKAALKAEVPECRVRQITALYDDHHDKLVAVEFADGTSGVSFSM